MSEQHLATAEAVAREAGKLLLAGTADMRRVNLETDKDVKIQADIESEALIRKALESSNLPIIGEEDGGDAALLDQDRDYWVVDPLDGTHNYLRGVPLCCVSIGLMRGLKPVLGVIYDFWRDEMFSGIVGHGLRINGQPHASRWAGKPEQASITTGFPSGRDYSSEALKETIARVQHYKKVRMIGTASLSVAYVAAGRYDVYAEEGVRLWDVAAGLAMAKAAGALFQMERSTTGKPFAFDVWVAGREEFIA